MILLLNLIPWLIVAIALFIVYRIVKSSVSKGAKVKRITLTGFSMFVLLMLYNMAYQSYVPEGEAKTTLSIPEYVPPAVPLVVENRLREAKIQENEQKYAEEFDWKKRVQENKEAREVSDK